MAFPNKIPKLKPCNRNALYDRLSLNAFTASGILIKEVLVGGYNWRVGMMHQSAESEILYCRDPSSPGVNLCQNAVRNLARCSTGKLTSTICYASFLPTSGRNPPVHVE